MIIGASPSKTHAHLANYWPETSIKQLGRTGLFVSSCGFGGYRIDLTIEDHKTALKRALKNGINLVDTSTNYSDGRSEALVGEILQDHLVARESTVIVTKAGYIQGQNYLEARKREEAGKPYGEVVKFDEGVWHCIHPEFLIDQIEQSLARLKVHSIDVFLIHNPEYYFMHLTKTNAMQDIEKAQYTFYDRIRRAFVALEDLVKKGKINHYGISSNNFVLPTSHQEATSLEVVLDIAKEVAKDMHGDENKHHFSVVQFPLNVYESGALIEKNNGEKTCLEFCKENDIGVLTNRPLNAIVGDGMKRLAVQVASEDVKDIDEAKSAVADLEKRFAIDFKEHLSDLIDKYGPPFKISAHLRSEELKKISSENWSMFAGSGLIPEVLTVCQSMDQIFAPTKAANDWELWKQQYFGVLQTFINSVAANAIKRENQELKKIEQKFDKTFSYPTDNLPMDQKAILPLISIEGPMCVLVGMRQERYVESIENLLKLDKKMDSAAVLSSISGLTK